MASVSIIGSGSWGTALAVSADRAGSQTTLWSKDESTVQGIIKTGVNPERFPGQKLSSSILATTNLEQACQANILVLAIPAQIVRQVNRDLGTAVLIIEQNVKVAFELSNRVYVMKAGRITLEESGEEMLKRGEWWDLF